MQKFTRPITREVEVAGDRVAFTFDDKGLNFRLVGTRRTPIEINWPDLVSLAVFQGKAPPTPEDVVKALETIGGGKNAGDTKSAPTPDAPAAESELGVGLPTEEPEMAGTASDH